MICYTVFGNKKNKTADFGQKKRDIFLERGPFQPFCFQVTCTLARFFPPCCVSQGALQCVVVVLEAFELQKMFGSLAPLASRGEVGHLDGGGSAPDRGTSQVFGC